MPIAPRHGAYGVPESVPIPRREQTALPTPTASPSPSGVYLAFAETQAALRAILKAADSPDSEITTDHEIFVTARRVLLKYS